MISILSSLHEKRIGNGVTVVIAAYNASATVGRAVKSALAQAEAVEVIVVDDASTDETIAAVHKADDGSNRLKVIAQLPNKGPSAARNLALHAATAPWIALLDSDDFFLPGRLKGLLAFADQADFIADDMWRVFEAEPNSARALVLNLKEPRSVNFREFVLSNISERGRLRQELGFIKPLMRREFLIKHNIAYKENMRLGEDYELYARALALGARMLIVPVHGYVSVWREHSLSGQHTPFDLLQLRDCDRNLSALPCLSGADRDVLRRHFLSIDCRLQWRNLIDAVKARSLRQIISCFMRPYPVPFYLLGQLAEQAVFRSKKLCRA